MILSDSENTTSKMVDSSNDPGMTSNLKTPQLQTNESGLPSYDMATSGTSSPGPFYAQGAGESKDVKVPYSPGPSPRTAGTSPSSPIAPFMPPTTVYNYVNPRTHEHVVSLLPPNHPEMICLQEGRHIPHTRYGFLGILAAVIWFPLGIGLCLLDRKVRCSRCGLLIDEGICG